MNILSNLFNSKKENKPIFMNEFVGADENRQVRTLKELSDRVPEYQKRILENEIKLIKIGLSGERNIKHELENSYMNIVCLHDIRLEYSGLSAQFDFIIISEKFICVIESKRLVGDIDINSDGDFTRVFKSSDGSVYKREGMYSPISQNEKHVKFLNKILSDNNLLPNVPIHSLVVSANEKTIINKHYAPAYIKNKITKHEHITSIFDKYFASSETSINNKMMFKIAEFLLGNVIEKDFDYIKKFDLNIIKEDVTEQVVEIDEVEQTTSTINVDNLSNDEHKKNDCAPKEDNQTDDSELVKQLKKYRYSMAKKLNIEFYFILNNEQIETIAKELPTTKEELTSIKGIAEKKYEQFGEDIIKLVVNSLSISNDSGSTDVSDDILTLKLKELRKVKAKEFNLELGFVFSNSQLEELISVKPKTKEQFLSIKGFGEKKYEQFGDSLISIFK